MTTTEAWRRALIGEWVDFHLNTLSIVTRLQRLIGIERGYTEIQRVISEKSIPHQAVQGMEKGVRYRLTWECFNARPFECSGTYIWFLELKHNGSLVMTKETSRGCACHGHTLDWEELMSVY